MKVAAPSSDVVASVAGSTCTQDYPWLPAYLELALAASAGRAEAIARRNRERAEQYEASADAQIVEALGSHSLEYPASVLAPLVFRKLQARGIHIGYRRIYRKVAALRKARHARTGADSSLRYRGGMTSTKRGSE